MDSRDGMETFYNVEVIVDGRPLRKFTNEHGDYVLSTPGTQYEISLTRTLGSPAVVEVFVDGQSVLCPPSQTRLLTSWLTVKGFEKRRVVRDCAPALPYLALPDPARASPESELEALGEMELAFEYGTFVFDFPQLDQNRTHPDLGTIRIELYDPLRVEVPSNQRRPPAVTRRENALQPRQGKKVHAIDRLTTREGDHSMSESITLRRRGPTHSLFGKGAHMGSLVLHYYNSLTHRDAGGHCRCPPSFGAGSGSQGSWFGGSGHRLGGACSRDEAMQRLGGQGSAGGASSGGPQPLAVPATEGLTDGEDGQLQLVLEASRLLHTQESEAADFEDLQLREAIRLSLLVGTTTAATSSGASASAGPVTDLVAPAAALAAPAAALAGAAAVPVAAAPTALALPLAAAAAADTGAEAAAARAAAAAGVTEEEGQPQGSEAFAAERRSEDDTQQAQPGTSAEAAAGPVAWEEEDLAKGDLVHVLWDGEWFPARVGRLLPEALVEVLWEEEMCRSHVPRTEVRRQVALGDWRGDGGGGCGQEPPPGEAPSAGTRVWAQCPSWGQEWFPGVVQRALAEGGVEVQWDDDGTVSNVALGQVRLAAA